MIETVYLIIIGSQVTLKGILPGEPDVEVPQHIVKWCGDLNNIDVYDITSGSLNELRLYDCYSFRLGYYDQPVTPINSKIHWKFY